MCHRAEILEGQAAAVPLRCQFAVSVAGVDTSAHLERINRQYRTQSIDQDEITDGNHRTVTRIAAAYRSHRCRRGRSLLQFPDWPGPVPEP
ncbi:hypothetical protein I547_6731 [Mycobacterium kansasii 824]|nr:hypothetical protein I547_6731 [Mycobacterium kansasii 824]